MSPGAPHWDEEVRKFAPGIRANQVPIDGRKTARSNVPSPSKSPGTGISPLSPHWIHHRRRVAGRGLANKPGAVEGTPHSQVGLAVAIKIARHGDVLAHAPLNCHGRRVVRLLTGGYTTRRRLGDRRRGPSCGRRRNLPEHRDVTAEAPLEHDGRRVAGRGLANEPESRSKGRHTARSVLAVAIEIARNTGSSPGRPH